MTTVTKRWWRAALAGVLTAAGGYALFGPGAAAQQPPAFKSAPAPASVNPMWARSSSPLSPAAASATPLPPAPGAVIPAGAVLPAAQPPLPPLPATPTVPALPQLPATPPLPPPVTTPMLPALPTAPLALPAVPPPPAPAAQPAPVVAPPAPPAKSALPVQPAVPAKSDSPLRAPDAGNSVKSDAAWKPAPVAPAPREAVPSVPTVRTVDRAKPPEVAVPPSERDVFPLPAPVVTAPPMLPAMPVPAPPAIPAPPVAGPPVAPMIPMTPAVTPPAPPFNPVATTPGADPMNFKSTAAAAVLGGALAMPAAKADAPATGGMAETQGAKDGAKSTPDEKLTEIQRDLKQLVEKLDGKRDKDGFPLPSDPGLLKDVRDLRDRMAALEKQVADLKTTSLRPTTPGAGAAIPGVPNPMPGPAADPAAAKGTVRVVNEYPVEITMVVNARSYRVAPTASVDIPIPAGDFSYQLLSAGSAAAPTRSTIRDREVVTLRIK